MWIIAVIVIGSLIVLGILLLSIPFDLAVELEVYGKPRLSVKWAWFFGWLGKEIKFGRRAPKQKKARRKYGLVKTVKRIQSAAKIIQTRGLIGQIFRLIKRIFHQLKIKRLEGEWYVGLDDPDETFYLFMLTEPINQLLNYSTDYPVSIHSSFIEPRFEGYLRSDLRLYPIRLIPPLMQFVFSVPTLRVIKQVVAVRWRRNR